MMGIKYLRHLRSLFDFGVASETRHRLTYGCNLCTRLARLRSVNQSLLTEQRCFAPLDAALESRCMNGYIVQCTISVSECFLSQLKESTRSVRIQKAAFCT